MGDESLDEQGGSESNDPSNGVERSSDDAIDEHKAQEDARINQDGPSDYGVLAPRTPRVHSGPPSRKGENLRKKGVPKSQFIGVYWDSVAKRWQARFKFRRQQITVWKAITDTECAAKLDEFLLTLATRIFKSLNYEESITKFCRMFNAEEGKKASVEEFKVDDLKRPWSDRKKEEVPDKEPEKITYEGVDQDGDDILERRRKERERRRIAAAQSGGGDGRSALKSGGRAGEAGGRNKPSGEAEDPSAGQRERGGSTGASRGHELAQEAQEQELQVIHDKRLEEEERTDPEGTRGEVRGIRSVGEILGEGEADGHQADAGAGGRTGAESGDYLGRLLASMREIPEDV